MAETIRFVTFLAPSLPATLFETVVGLVGASLRRPVAVRAETRRSGPSGPEDDPLSRGEAEVAFLCPPTYLWLSRHPGARVDLIGAAPVFSDPRARGRPVYFAELVVPAASTARRLEDLRGAVFAYNDVASLSGLLCVLDRLEEMGERPSFFRRLRRSGSHLASLALVASGQADAAAIDSNALALAKRRDPGLGARLRVLDVVGSFPAQPVLARADLAAGIRDGIEDALLRLGHDPAARAALADFGLVGFAPVAPADYHQHPALRRASRRPPPRPLVALRRRAAPPPA